MTVLHTVASIHPDAGGTSRTVRTTCNHLAEQGIEVELVSSREPGAPALTPSHDRVTTTFAQKGERVWDAWSFQQVLSERIEASQPALIHDNGIWLTSNIVSALEAYRREVPHVVTTHGMLESWALNYQRARKKMAWYVYQRRILQEAACLHATAPMEANQLRSLGLTAPIAVIPNGVPLPDRWKQKSSDGSERQALFLSRIHPKKGLPMLLDAWADLRPSHWRLLIVGPD
jgi:glycosyltransferase involved in cell wall biosynthesis